VDFVDPAACRWDAMGAICHKISAFNADAETIDQMETALLQATEYRGGQGRLNRINDEEGHAAAVAMLRAAALWLADHVAPAQGPNGHTPPAAPAGPFYVITRYHGWGDAFDRFPDVLDEAALTALVAPHGRLPSGMVATVFDPLEQMHDPDDREAALIAS